MGSVFGVGGTNISTGRGGTFTGCGPAFLPHSRDCLAKWAEFSCSRYVAITRFLSVEIRQTGSDDNAHCFHFARDFGLEPKSPDLLIHIVGYPDRFRLHRFPSPDESFYTIYVDSAIPSNYIWSGQPQGIIIMSDIVTINGVEYAPVKKTAGARAVIVVDRGWVFAGDVERSNGRIKLTNALHVFKWENIGFAGMIADPKKAKADLRPVSDVDIPLGAEIFTVPVPDGWGLK